jgi:16S rRNA (cytosine967-C5)-methyltransferase
MRAPGRAAAAIDVLADIEARRRPASEALKDWGASHRFAGAGDRAAIGNLVFDALRKRWSHAARMGEEGARALVLAVLRWDWGLGADEVATLCDPSVHGPAPVSAAEAEALAREDAPAMPASAAADTPDWLWPHFERAFAAEAIGEGQGLAQRAPVDLRANALKADRAKVVKALAAFGAADTPFAPYGVRIPATQGAQRAPHLESEPPFQRGWFEVQDEASQIAAVLAGAAPGQQVADICAGAGGKTLALAAAMANKGQIHAHDADKHRLAPIFARLRRAGARNVQIHPAGAALDDLAGKMDLVFVDAPCTGSGAWRRNPDAKARLTPRAFEQRLAQQRAVLDLGARLVKPGGRLIYATCSVLPPENEDQVGAFFQRTPGFAAIDAERLTAPLGPKAGAFLAAARGKHNRILMSPRRTGTDGFFLVGLQKEE